MTTRIRSFFEPREIPVEFRDLPPTHSIDTSLFDAVAYHRVVTDGFFECSPAELLQAAAVHYQGRFRESRPLQWLNACFEVLPSLVLLTSAGGRGLRLNSNESGEFQKKSTEVIAVGLGLALCRKLFRTRYQDIATIETTRKRCDFSFSKNGQAYVLETRGRKRAGEIRPAIDDVFDKKANYSGAKYGFVSYLPRKGQISSMIVVDPPTKAHLLEDWNRIARLLRYYSSAARLARFWRLSALLNERADALGETKDFTRFDRKALNLGNIEKLGHALEVTFTGTSAQFFVPRAEGREGLWGSEGYAFIIGLDPALFQALEAQDFGRLLDFQLPVRSTSEGDIAANVNDDGTVFAAISKDRLGEIVNQ